MLCWYQGVVTYAGSRPLLPGDNPNVGHSQRVFALKYHPDDNNMFISGGWDNALKVILPLNIFKFLVILI